MLGENKNLKDVSNNFVKDINLPLPNLPLIKGEELGGGLHYTKTNKLITALYMVTDTMEKEEPIRLKLRTLGVETLSDITSLSKGNLDNLEKKISIILSFLNIAFDLRMISEMNCNILTKEFIELKQSLKELTVRNHLWLEEFINSSSPDKGRIEEGFLGGNSTKAGPLSGPSSSTRIGVQKGSTLMQALSRVGGKTLSDIKNKSNAKSRIEGHDNFEILKNKRRELISKIIKGKLNGASIKDIVLAIKGSGEVIGEKTLQRELVSMVSDKILYRTGSKRWSLYFLQ